MRDMFAWDGPEWQRPFVWGQMIDAKRQSDYQQMTIGRYVNLRPDGITSQFPHFPPTDHTRANPGLFERWERTQQQRQEWSRSQASGDKAELDALVCSFKVGDRVLRNLDGGLWEERAYIFHDARLGYDLCVDHAGSVATSDHSKASVNPKGVKHG